MITMGAVTAIVTTVEGMVWPSEKSPERNHLKAPRCYLIHTFPILLCTSKDAGEWDRHRNMTCKFPFHMWQNKRRVWSSRLWVWLIAHHNDKAEQHVQKPNNFALQDFHGYALAHKVRLCTEQPFSIQKPPFAAIVSDRWKEAQINATTEHTVGNFLQATFTLAIQQRYCCHRSEWGFIFGSEIR